VEVLYCRGSAGDDSSGQVTVEGPMLSITT
jgi:hypothetical protein